MARAKGIRPTDTAGFSAFMGLVSNLVRGSEEREQELYRRWVGRRFTELRSRLDVLCEDSRIQVFFDEYASALADQLRDLLLQGPPVEPAQACIDYLEAINVQSVRFAEAMEPSPAEVEVDQLALAA